MKTKAAVLYGPHQEFVVEELDIADPKEREVMVRVHSCGVCHSDMHVIEGDVQWPFPVVMGHEAAGVVEKVGPGVTSSKPGDHVIISFAPSCGVCKYCVTGRPNLCVTKNMTRGTLPDGTTRLSKHGKPYYHFAKVAGFAEYTVVTESCAVPIRRDVPLDRACLIGCGVSTGMGASLRTAKVEPGSTVAVFGAGGVGLNCIQGAALAGAARIFAVDVLDNKLAKAKEFGATDLVNASKVDPVAKIKELTGGRGVDYALEAIGNTKVILQAFDATAAGGKCVVVGIAPTGATITLPASGVMNERIFTGSSYGSTRARVDFPVTCDMYMDGKVKLDELITGHYPLEKINDAFAALKSGKAIRSVIDIAAR